jgi:hypothetical protein
LGRDIKGGGVIEILLRDGLRQSLRMFKHEKQYAAACIVALSLGIAASTALFAVVYKVLILPLPYKDAERLVVVWEKNIKQSQNRVNVAPPTFLDWRAQQRVFIDCALFVARSTSSSGSDLYFVRGGQRKGSSRCHQL